MRDHSVGESNPQLFQPDTLLPSQFFHALRRKTSQEPEKRLVLAILQDAIECYQKHLFARDNKAQQLFLDAQAWLMSDERDYFFAFDNICELLDINPEFLRRGLLAWRERQAGGQTQPRSYTMTGARQEVA